MLSIAWFAHTMIDRRRFVGLVAAAALLPPAPARAQRRPVAPTPPLDLLAAAERARADMLRAADEYRASLERVLAFYQADLNSSTAHVARQQDLVAQGLMAPRDVAESERARAEAQDHVDETRRRLAEADQLIAEASAALELARHPALAPGASLVTRALIRFNGRSPWSLTDTDKLRRFFAEHFGRALPVSAYGQTPVHDRLGFDHHNALDVAVHPDSAEGRSLLEYLRRLGVPYLAFRAAVPGAATGAHVHVGPPSERLG